MNARFPTDPAGDHGVAPHDHEPPRDGLPGPAPGTVVLGLAVVTLGVGAAVQILTGRSPDPRYAAATMLAAFGALLVMISLIGLWLGRRRNGPAEPGSQSPRSVSWTDHPGV